MFMRPCIPVKKKTAPSGSQWIHEIKYDGYRLIVRRSKDGVTLYTRNGADWTERYPRIAAAAAKLPGSFVLDGEVVVCRKDGTYDFDALHSRKHDRDAILYAFDLMEWRGRDLRALPLIERKARLKALLRKRGRDIHLCEHIEGDGPAIFAHACKLGLEGIVSKRRESRYRSGRCTSWIKIKNPESPAFHRALEGNWHLRGR